MTGAEIVALLGPFLLTHGPEIAKAVLDIVKFIRAGEPFMVVARPKPLDVDERMGAIDRRLAREGLTVAEAIALDEADDLADEERGS